MVHGVLFKVKDFVTSIGNGSYNEGRAILQQQYTDVTNGGSYEDISKEKQKVFAEFLLNLLNWKYFNEVGWSMKKWMTKR
ncbi:hypothetical protein [Enterococcus sp. RIT-PI-f]|uniref:hypothetical protein n=1 Tax=Enterococcus sp. RIT-PI-f TaxID=1690244 RepID=UPI0006B9A8A0|nr:hypothetical protein [Enterococcus sp. RIT-PI-f]KPG72104.1 hypothetical protein AEQ18_02400 [Enterococcus sp. RIT-PI-f]